MKANFDKWKEEKTPRSTHKREGTEVLSKSFRIYKDDNIEVDRIEEPTYFNEHENYIRVQIKQPTIYFNVSIGGWVTRKEAIEMAKYIVKSL